jgi:hypothetical protein
MSESTSLVYSATITMQMRRCHMRLVSHVRFELTFKVNIVVYRFQHVRKVAMVISRRLIRLRVDPIGKTA